VTALPAGVDYQFMGFKIVRGTSFLSEKGEVCVDALRVEFEASSTDVEHVEVNADADGKVLENGKLLINKNGVKYNMQGAVLK
jgi:hypothetical protein